METVSSVTGTPKEDLLRVYEAYSKTGVPDKAGTIMYAMGWCQHTVGVQNIRAMSIIQLLLGNMGMAGGGVNALRGESNVQGSTDQGLLYHIWPGYNPAPTASLATLVDYNKKNTPLSKDPLSANWWQNRPKYIASYLKALFGDKAQPENDFCYAWMPKLEEGKAYSWLDLFDAMYRKELTGFFSWGQNPACSGANSNKTREAMANLDWMVVVNLFDNETASFWKGPGMNPKKIKTEVFYLPCAASMEKEGSLSNSGRWTQWRYKAQNPPGQAKPDGDIIVELFEEIRKLYKKPGGVFPDPIINLKFDYTTNHNFDPHLVAKAINGYFTKDVTVGDKTFKKGDPVPAFAMLQADGSTSCGNWTLLPELQPGRQQHGAAGQSRRERHRTLSQMVLGLARQPQDHLQSGVHGPDRQTVEPEEVSRGVCGRSQRGQVCLSEMEGGCSGRPLVSAEEP